MKTDSNSDSSKLGELGVREPELVGFVESGSNGVEIGDLFNRGGYVQITPRKGPGKYPVYVDKDDNGGVMAAHILLYEPVEG